MQKDENKKTSKEVFDRYLITPNYYFQANYGAIKLGDQAKNGPL